MGERYDTPLKWDFRFVGAVTIPCVKNGIPENNGTLSKVRAKTRLQNYGPVILGKRRKHCISFVVSLGH